MAAEQTTDRGIDCVAVHIAHGHLRIRRRRRTPPRPRGIGPGEPRCPPGGGRSTRWARPPRWDGCGGECR
ncbi:hypothetical protein C8259_25130 [Nocardia nova]|uniref:Uncharacterized protein n=1 Tax=Nocardia nova TaxID=37330 RepID=A0A2T2YWN7_9NOCA|nr:hypothetical protein C8259_25130 [Nocardia nova]